MELLKLLSANLVVAQIICFLVLLWLMKRFLWKPAFQTIEARRDRMASELKAVEDAKADVAKLKAEYQDFLSRVDELARKRMKEIEAEGDARAHEIREKARLEAERIVEDARLDIRYEWGKTREALKKDMIEMVISVTERMIQEKLTFEDDRKIIDGFLKELEQPS